MSIAALYSPMERALLAAYLHVPDPNPKDLAGIDITRPVPRRWSETRGGIGPRASELGSHALMLENAVARICLESIQNDLPQWAVLRDGSVELGRPRRRAKRRTRDLSPLHLFTINWGDSGPGFSCRRATTSPGCRDTTSRSCRRQRTRQTPTATATLPSDGSQTL